jgi:F0F1-type ATP synthase assembly protein I
MENHNEHTMHANHNMIMHEKQEEKNTFILALSATLHCLIGCGIGEVVGMIIGTALNMSMIDTTILSVILGFIAGLSLGVVPLLRAKFTFRNAFKTVLIAEGLSIVVMEAFEVMTQWMIPGVMEAHLTDWIFWTGMLAALIVGFIAALPVNYIMIKRGVRHQH